MCIATFLIPRCQQENGAATAAEAIYRDLDYARSLIKHAATDESDVIEDGHSTIRDHHHPRQRRPSSSHSDTSSNGSGRGASSEDWSVISDSEDRRSSMGSRRSEGAIDRSSSFKRNSLAAAVMSVVPNALHSTPSHRRNRSKSSTRS